MYITRFSIEFYGVLAMIPQDTQSRARIPFFPSIAISSRYLSTCIRGLFV